MSAIRTPAEPNSGAKMSPRLAARVHYTLGRSVNASSDQAVLYGEELIAAIQAELEAVFRRGTGVHSERTEAPIDRLSRESRNPGA